MAKRFFDVFPSLQVEGDMKNLLTETEVTKVGMNHERDHLRVYLEQHASDSQKRYPPVGICHCTTDF